jgi:hypothetical protein
VYTQASQNHKGLVGAAIADSSLTVCEMGP